MQLDFDASGHILHELSKLYFLEYRRNDAIFASTLKNSFYDAS